MRTLAFDCETTDLKALMGRVLCASFVEIKEEKTKPWTLRGDSRKYKGSARIDDSLLCVAIRDTLEEYDMVVSWNGKMFDVPFLNARLAKAGERPFHPHFHLDAMWYAGGSSMRIGSKKLDVVQKFFSLSQAKTPISWADWQNAAAGNRKAMRQVIRHCEADVLVLREAYWKLLPSVATIHR